MYGVSKRVMNPGSLCSSHPYNRLKSVIGWDQEPDIMRAHRISLLWVLLCIGISIFWGVSIGRGDRHWVDFRAVYAGTRTLMHGHNPYRVSDVEREYLSEGGERPTGSDTYAFQAITLYVNMPTTFVFVAPFAALPWKAACTLWMLLTGVTFTVALLLMWSVGARSALDVSTLLACILAINSEITFCQGNTAGIVVGSCVIAAWCLIYERFVWIGVVCLGLSLAVKPHDVGFVWLYFLLVGGACRRRALQSLLITAGLGIVSFLWTSHIAPGWMQDWVSNLAAISTPGGINEPGPHSVTAHFSTPVIDLQAVISIFRDEPRFYDAVTYVVVGVLLLVWAVWTLRSQFTPTRAWFGIAGASALTMLITYHRPWDAKLVMLAIPACCLLWQEGGRAGKAAFWVTAAAIFFAGDIPLVCLNTFYSSQQVNLPGIAGKLYEVLMIRTATVALLPMGIFYLYVYVKRGARERENVMDAELTEVSS
jgi:hypothetical protein